MTQAPFIQIQNLSKSYGGVHALTNVHLNITRGEIHSLCGENGAGKSTLIKILTGVVTPDQGSILIDGTPLPLGNVQQCEQAGVAVIHQESTTFPDLNTIDNIFVGREPRSMSGLLLDKKRMESEAVELLSHLDQDFDMHRPVSELSVAQRQVVAMARALSQKCQLLILDEPTASLSARESAALLNIVRKLRGQGVTILYVSHRLEEIFDLTDRVSVLRDGQYVDTREVNELDKDQLIHLMVGREVEELTQRHEHEGHIGDVQLEVKNLCSPGTFHNINLQVCAGEIVGLAGLIGAGRSEIARAVFGIDAYSSGQIKVNNKPLRPNSVQAALAAGIALVPEDRQHEGLVLPMSVGNNISLAILKTLTRAGLINTTCERETIAQLMSDLLVKASSQDAPGETLSGGNQQKLVIAKWLATQPKVLILDEPTRGVDVGAKAQVHRLIRDLAAKGVATLMISSDMPEILSLSDRVIVIREGSISGKLNGPTATQQQILSLALPEHESQLS